MSHLEDENYLSNECVPCQQQIRTSTASYTPNKSVDLVQRDYKFL